MKLKTINLLFSFVLGYFLLTAIAYAQAANEPKKDEPQATTNTGKLVVKLFEIKHRRPQDLQRTLHIFGSGAPGAAIDSNDGAKALIVKDYPENIAAIEDALKRLDVPETSSPRRFVSLEFQIHLLSASTTSSEKSPIPKNLEPVVAQLRSTLKFTNYRYFYSAVNRLIDGGKIDSNGITGSLFPAPSGTMNTPATPSFYQYSLYGVNLMQDTSGKDAVLINQFKFGVRVPIKVDADKIQYQDIGINTTLHLREGEMAVVGTANISGSDEAIIVVVSIKKIQ